MADQIEVHDGSGYRRFGGVPGPTHFVRLGGEWLTPRQAGDLIADPNVREIDWDAGWLYPVLLNGWTNHSAQYAEARYRKSSGGLVICEGMVKDGTINQFVFTFPASYRTNYRLILSCMSGSNTVNGRLNIVGGNLTCAYGNNSFVSLQFMFYADL